ncbi:hypothetical protein H632_c1747p0 [Helicosporidium sp. ATCC 50920]|nr:hypothetical protein H632_c1747p0 [Helicosporidium sp. ATCC 50920]|eukprot:KDD73900.1 hypothetical protein H632_c1747p0 [Helicosporidium sp. ATCC 50920]
MAALPGEVVALMGPSGSGKTSLLSIAGGRAQRSMRIQGDVTFNGAPMTKSLKRRLGYVMQDDLLYESLTVFETLHYAAALRLPRRLGAAERSARVERVISTLELGDCRDTIIGGFMRKGVSGGERKRAAVGHELLNDPSVLLLDEPTSGLDSTTALHLLQALRELARAGRSVVTTIHQPSARLFAMLDRVLLLSKGRAQYYGRSADVVDWCDRLGCPVPFGTNLADYILDLASGDAGEGAALGQGEALRRRIVLACERHLASGPALGYVRGAALEGSVGLDGRGGESFQGEAPQGGAPKGEAPQGGAPKGSDPKGPASPRLRAAALDASTALYEDAGEEQASRWGQPFWKQTVILCSRTMRTRRFDSFASSRVCMIVAVAVLSGLFWLQIGSGETVDAMTNTIGLLYFYLMFLVFAAMFTALFTFPAQHKMMLKERASGMYRISAFYTAISVAEIPMDMALPTLMIVIIYFMAGLKLSAAAFFGSWSVVILAMLVSQGMGMCVGIIWTNLMTAQYVATVVALTATVAGGFFVRNIPAWLQWIRYLSFVYYAFQVQLYFAFNGGADPIYSCTVPGTCVQDDPPDPAQNASCERVDDLQAAFQLYQDPASRSQTVMSAGILIAMLAAFRVLAYVLLRWRTAGH